MTIIEIRELFPHLKTEQIYFNHAAIGPWSSPALNRINEYSIQRSGEKIENYPFTVKWNISAKEKLGKIIGAQPERIAWVDNVSNGINILAQGLNWKRGDRIILNDLEFPSNVYPFLNLKKLGVEIDFVKSDNGICDIDEIEKALAPKTKLISISLVQFLSGYRADSDAIGELCKRKNIIFSVDAIQATGAVQIDVVKSKIDFLSGGSQKWLMSSQGVSYIYLTEELQSRIDQKFVGWTSVKDAWNLLDYNLTLRDTADAFQNGTMNVLGISIFEAVLNMFIDFAMQNVEQKILENSDYFINCLTEMGIQPILKNVAEKNRAGIVSFKHDDAQKIFEQLQEKRIYAAVREGMLRISPHFYNTKDEIDRFIEELKKLL
jgi:cysteine desulfurase / selenocysteine lyase